MRLFIDVMYSSSPKKICPTNRTIIKYFDDTWSSDLLDMKDYGPKNNRGYRYIVVIIDNFSKFGWTIPLKSKHAQSITHKLLKHQDVNQISLKRLMVRNMSIKFSTNF